MRQDIWQEMVLLQYSKMFIIGRMLSCPALAAAQHIPEQCFPGFFN